MRDGKQEVGDVLRDPVTGETRVVEQIWSGKEIVMPYPESIRTGYGINERCALFGWGHDRRAEKGASRRSGADGRAD